MELKTSSTARSSPADWEKQSASIEISQIFYQLFSIRDSLCTLVTVPILRIRISWATICNSIRSCIPSLEMSWYVQSSLVIMLLDVLRLPTKEKFKTSILTTFSWWRPFAIKSQMDLLRMRWSITSKKSKMKSSGILKVWWIKASISTFCLWSLMSQACVNQPWRLKKFCSLCTTKKSIIFTHWPRNQVKSEPSLSILSGWNLILDYLDKHLLREK